MMQKIQKKVQELLKDKGQGIVEYALILGFVAIVALALFKSNGLNSKIDKNVTAVGGELDKMASIVNVNTSNIKVAP